MRKLGFLAGAALGYIFGAKAGRERYDQIKDAAQKVANHPTVQQVKTEAQDQATRLKDATKDKISEKVSDTRWIPTGDKAPDSAAELTDDTWASSTGKSK